MWTDLHLLRPWWLLALLPLVLLTWQLRQQKPFSQAWGQICDPHLLAHLSQHNKQKSYQLNLFFLCCSLFWVIISCTGPAWIKLPVATYKTVQPRVILLDMSESMLQTDLSPNRLSRAKFILHDLLAQKGLGQLGLVVFTGEPFILSPLTDDGKTIDALLKALNPEVMPVGGYNLEQALEEARQLIKDAGYKTGELLVLTANSPSTSSIQLANKMASKGFHLSIMPITAETNINPLFTNFAQAGQGEMIPYNANSAQLKQWLSLKSKSHFTLNKEDQVSLWRDEGSWFLIPALLFLLPLFQRERLQGGSL